jgi:hypothetical protein
MVGLTVQIELANMVAVQCLHDTDPRDIVGPPCVATGINASMTACIPRPHARTGETQRILPHAIRQDLTTTSSGALIAATEGSTRPVTMHITNAGIATVEQYDLRMP